MEVEFSTEQLVVMVNSLTKTFKENPSAFKLRNPPQHSMDIQIAKSLAISFSSDGWQVNIEIDGYPGVAYCPYFWKVVPFFKHVIARQRLWNLAESMLRKPLTAKAERLMYEAFPEMLEKHIDG